MSPAAINTSINLLILALIIVAAIASIGLYKNYFKKFPKYAIDGTMKGTIIYATDKNFMVVTKVIRYNLVSFRNFNFKDMNKLKEYSCRQEAMEAVAEEIMQIPLNDKSYLKDFIASYDFKRHSWYPVKKDKK